MQNQSQEEHIKKMLAEKTNPNLFKNFRRGDQLAFQIEPICTEKEIPDPDNPGKTKKVPECMPHADTPHDLAEAFDEVRTTLAAFGFQVQIFGTPLQMLDSLNKRFNQQGGQGT